ncbi:Golgi SNAP receptor complex member 1-2 isoform X3 [Selaginella moellendorffii]|uniref:Golgi SNAP receptor complex member 1-2 isoform X3 n=1 Tax=Selaginella moellendorffii TaxID=88036 RepID=UPI000D1C39E1|nr:Golgi SNAP receptor complex member 1-2 isoform X3 [Selaginella moellendorffii]XP_024533937.1 Golgi SNAP receptor complex member 1-2 isoform X3 [Selaginella moellendorffii]|eukprot:XP_024523007.1 Golgi SNAP receptor complex member 1-2 isoform X3 [Selaginella moellendorffii]
MEEGDVRWEELRREARKIEGDLDVKLSSYAKLGGMLAHGDGHGAGAGDVAYNSMEMEIESLLEKLLDLNDAMSRCVASATSTASISQKLARHRDILHELTQEFRRTRGNINSMREHADLLSSVRSEISEFKASGNVSPGPSLLRERAAIHGSISQIDDVIGQAQATKAALSFQRSTFLEIQGKMKQLSDRFPIVRSLLGAIKRKRSRDTLILSAVIAFCLLFLLIYWMAK